MGMNKFHRIFDAGNTFMRTPDEQRKRRAALMAHILIWLLVFLVPILFETGERERSVRLYLMFSVPMFFNLAVFYLNYSFLIERYLFKREIWKYLLINLLIFVAASWIVMLFHTVWLGPPPGTELPPMRPVGPEQFIWIRTIVSLLMVSGLSVAIRMTGQWYRAERIRAQLEQARVESELSNLKNQLSPHFFFNTLNNIYSMIATRPEEARKAVHQLSKLIRYVLYESDHEQVPLKSELLFVRSYIDLMSFRYPQHVKIEQEIPDPPGDPFIAPLLFISLIENAFKHGTSPTEGSVIRIRILTSGEGEKATVECLTENSYFPKDEEDKSGSGIGLENLRKRLELIYPGRYTLEQEVRDGLFVSHLTLNL